MDFTSIACSHVVNDSGQECGQPLSRHVPRWQDPEGVYQHEFKRPEFPVEDPTFEVWEFKDGKPLRKVADGMVEDRAREVAEQWSSEPVSVGSTTGLFLPVQVMVQRSFAIRPEDISPRR